MMAMEGTTLPVGNDGYGGNHTASPDGRWEKKNVGTLYVPDELSEE